MSLKTLKVLPSPCVDVRDDYQGSCASGALRLRLYSRERGAPFENLDYKQMKEIKEYKSAGRMNLTGLLFMYRFFFVFLLIF